MKQILKQVSIVLILIAMGPSMVMAGYADDQPDVVWFSTSTSGLVNRSSMEMASNHTNRSIRFALKALEKGLSLPDELIANHNLCIAYLVTDKAELATKYCARTFKIAQGSLSVLKIRGAYHLSEEDNPKESRSTSSLIQLLVSNVLQHHSQLMLSLQVR
jgi:hypothetical protein